MATKRRVAGVLIMALVWISFAGACQANLFTVAGFGFGNQILSGTFEYDSGLDQYSNWNITADWSAYLRGSFTYTPGNSSIMDYNLWGRETNVGPLNFALAAPGVPENPGDLRDYAQGELWLRFAEELTGLAPGQSADLLPGSPNLYGTYDAWARLSGMWSYLPLT